MAAVSCQRQHHTYVLKRNRYLLHGRNNAKKIASLHEEENYCFTDQNNTKKRKKIPAYKTYQGRWGGK